MPTITHELIREFFEAMRQFQSGSVVGRPRVPGAKELAARLRMSPDMATSGRLTPEEVTIVNEIIEEWGEEAITISAVAGDRGVALVGQEVAPRPQVLVEDGRGEPVANALVRFFVAGGGGIVKGSKKRTNRAGVAEVGAWILGNFGGPNQLTAIAGSASVTFRARVATRVEPMSAVQDQGVAGRPVAARQVKVTDAAGNGVRGVPVTFRVTGGGGGFGGDGVAFVVVLTDEDGVASTPPWMLGAAPGKNIVTVEAGPGNKIEFQVITVLIAAPVGVRGAAENPVEHAPLVEGLADVRAARGEPRHAAAPAKNRQAGQAAAARDRRPRG